MAPARPQKRPRGAQSLAANLALSAAALIFVLLALECFFRFGVAKSDGFAFTLASKRWDAKYWKPINSLGYRDDEHFPEQLAQVNTVFVAGDSLAAGHGVRDYRDRFANVLNQRLGEDWDVALIAQRAWNTANEVAALAAYPYQRPDVVVLSYYLNDIPCPLIEYGFYQLRPDNPLEEFLDHIVGSSHFVNFVYWRLFRFKNAKSMAARLWDSVYQCFNDADLWEFHQRELSSAASYARSRGARLIVVVFPNLADVTRSEPYTSKVVDFLRSQGIEAIDLAEKLRDRPSAELIVNRYDAHPNEAVHAEVAGYLYEKIAGAAPVSNGSAPQPR